MHVCGVQLSLVLPYCLIYTRSREREKVLFGGPLGVLQPLTDTSRSVMWDYPWIVKECGVTYILIASLSPAHILY